MIKDGHRPAGFHLKPGPCRFMCLSRRFIFALMPLCSALYWCFCHVVKIYGAISLPWNGLIEVSGLVDLWPNMAGRGGKREKEEVLTHKTYIFILMDGVQCPFTQKKAKEKTQTADIVSNRSDTLHKIIQAFCDVHDECFHLSLAWTICSDVSPCP